MLPKAAGLVALCLLIGFGATVSAVAAETPRPELIYGQFKRYRLALADPDLNATSFFSRRANEIWGGELLVRRTPVQLMDDVVVNRNRYRLGDKVHVVYSYTVTTSPRGAAVLGLVFGSKKSPLPAILRLTYVMDDGQWRIDAIDTDTSHSKDLKVSAVLDTFD